MTTAKHTKILLAASIVALATLAGGVMIAGPVARMNVAAAASAEEPEPVQTAKAETPVLAKPEPAPAPDGPFVIKRILPISGPIKYGEWHWDDANVLDGPIVITVDLDARVLSIFKGGHEIGATAVLLGTEEKPTPTGVFPITQKRRHHVSNLYGAPMPYMQRLTNDGISLHGSEVEWGYASHGCIGMPEDFAAKVFAQTKVGDRVFITRGKKADLGDSLVDS
ncbi:MAG: L,D-transpeptidase family protein [Novosphingobium sp.]|nr:L,D-transpeptidase family protein [Novosphingobium sp.]